MGQKAGMRIGWRVHSRNLFEVVKLQQLLAINMLLSNPFSEG
jgi:hypothetical protein